MPDDRFNLMFVHKCNEFPQLLPASHRGTEELILAIKEIAQIKVDRIFRRRPEDDDSSALLQHFKRTVERRSTYAINDEINRFITKFFSRIAIRVDRQVGSDIQ